MKVHGWRHDPDQTLSVVTQRLLRWLAQLAAGSSLEGDGVVVLLENALMTLTSARRVLVVPHETANRPAEEISVLLPREFWQQLPAAPFFCEDADEAWRATLADWLHDTHSLEAPSLVLPLPGGGSGGSSGSTHRPALAGCALLWMETADGLLDETWQTLCEAVAQSAGALLARAWRRENWARSYRQLCEAFAAAVDARDGRRAGHSEAAAFYAAMIAREMELAPVEVEHAELAALLHGLGKIAVPDSILQKAGTLTPEELQVVHNSAAEGARWLAEVEGLEEVANAIRHQGERYDGAGYPDGLRGEEITPVARILALALRFAAMTRPRADRPALSVVGGALEFLAYEAGSALDPQVVRVFLSAMGRSEGGTTGDSSSSTNMP